VTHVAMSSAPHERTRLLRAAVDHGGELTTGQAARALRATSPTARKAMKALALLGLVDLRGEADHGTGAIFTLRPEWAAVLGRGPVADTGPDPFKPPGPGPAEVESEMPLCVSVPTESAGEVDPWAS
jgi:hypothetical protein